MRPSPKRRPLSTYFAGHSRLRPRSPAANGDFSSQSVARFNLLFPFKLAKPHDSLRALRVMTNLRKFRTIWQLSCLLIVGITFYLFRQGVTRMPRETAPPQDHEIAIPAQEDSASPATQGILSKITTDQHVKSILDPDDTSLPRLNCPQPDTSRYDYLKPTGPVGSQVQYFFALNLKECLPLLPRLLGSIVAAIRYLGPEHCALSIVEGNSPDGTAEVLSALQPEMDRLLGGRAYFVLSNAINP
ncbi:MAG: alpha,3-mannosyltransferase, partial [Mucilaginibacter sp.]|nr:alpha,3-mannosyltransferase [Mucilaginibacter sp.]